MLWGHVIAAYKLRTVMSSSWISLWPFWYTEIISFISIMIIALKPTFPDINISSLLFNVVITCHFNSFIFKLPVLFFFVIDVSLMIHLKKEKMNFGICSVWLSLFQMETFLPLFRLTIWSINRFWAVNCLGQVFRWLCKKKHVKWSVLVIGNNWEGLFFLFSFLFLYVPLINELI